jgi:2'-5' RNA ligase
LKPTDDRARVFTAIDIPDEIKGRVYDRMEDLRRVGTIRFVDTESLHITLNFFGDLNKIQLAHVIKALNNLNETRFPVSLGGFDFFGGRRPEVIFIGVMEGAEDIRSIHSKLLDSLEGIVIPRGTNRFVPHLTVGRVRQYQKNMDKILSGFAAMHSDNIGTFICDRIVLKKSEFASGKVVHVELQRRLLL